MACFKIVLCIVIVKLSSVLSSIEFEDWCIDSEYVVNNSTIDKQSCRDKPCVISTCPSGQLFVNGTCEFIPETMDVSNIFAVYSIKTGTLVKTDKYFNETFQIVNYPDFSIYLEGEECTIGYNYIEKTDAIEGVFLEDGSFALHSEAIVRPEQYIVHLKLVDEEPVLYVKLPKDSKGSPIQQIMDKVTNILMLVSVFFMVLVIIVYILCKELQNLHGLIFITHLAGLSLTFVLTATRIKLLEEGVIYDTGCIVISVILHIIVFVITIWWCILGFRLWWSLREKNMLKGMSKRANSGKAKSVNYRMYFICCLIAWVPSILYVGIEVYVDENTTLQGPNFRDCTTGGNPLFMAVPAAILLIINVVLYILTTVNILRARRKNSKQFKAADPESTGRSLDISLFVRLSLTLGVTWIFDVVFNFFEDQMQQDWMIYLKYTTDLYNCSIGVIMFIIFVFRAHLLLKLFRRFSINNKITKHLERRVSRSNNNYKSQNSSQRSNLTNSTTVGDNVEWHPEPGTTRETKV